MQNLKQNTWMKSNAEVAPFVSEVTQKGLIDAVIKAASSRLPSSKTSPHICATMRPCNAGDMNPKLCLHSRRTSEPSFGDFLWRCKNIPTLFLCLGWGGDGKTAPFFCDFAVLSVKNGAKIGVLTLLYAPKKVLYLVVKGGLKSVDWGGAYHQLCFLGGEKATFLATTKIKKRGDATIFRGGSSREGLAKIRGDVRVGRGFL
ncbi:MAG: hypothetical protein K6B45_04930 [Bacteroidaceae bacterium]|nr:hypothetical protein [Bacteroidaceae bacterium]